MLEEAKEMQTPATTIVICQQGVAFSTLSLVEGTAILAPGAELHRGWVKSSYLFFVLPRRPGQGTETRSRLPAPLVWVCHIVIVTFGDSWGSRAWTSSLEALTFLTTAAEAEGSRNTCCLKMVTSWLLLYEALLQSQ